MEDVQVKECKLEDFVVWRQVKIGHELGLGEIIGETSRSYPYGVQYCTLKTRSPDQPP